MALRKAASVRMSFILMPRAESWASARAERRAMSSQIGLARRRQRRVRQRQAERFADHLRCRRSAQELAAAARRAASVAAFLGRLFESDLAVSVAGADGLNLGGILVPFGGKHDAAGNKNRRQIVHRGQRHHHRRQALVARRHAQHSGARRARNASIGAALWPRRCGREGYRTCRRVPCVRPSHGSVQAPAKGINPSFLNSSAAALTSKPTSQCPECIPKRDRAAIFSPDAAVCGQNQEFLASQCGRVPTHADVLRPAEQIAARRVPEQFIRKG